MTQRISLRCSLLVGILVVMPLGSSCSDSTKAAPTKTEITRDPDLFTVDHPELFKLANVGTRALPTIFSANGVVAPDVNRTIHVTSQGSGRVVDLRVRLGDNVRKGQVLLSIYSADLTGAFSDYEKAQADERLTKKALDREQLLLSRGAAAQKDVEQAEDSEDKAKVDVRNSEQHIRILGGDPAHSSSTIELRAPVTGTIVEQNVSGFEGVKSLDNSPNLLTIADLSQVWAVCDVFENDLGQVHLGDPAELRLNAFPDRAFRGKISDISRVLDPNTRSAKVRIVLLNTDGALRPGMYAVATFRSRRSQQHLVIPSTAMMRLQDRDWVFRKDGAQTFRQVEVHTTGQSPDGMNEIQDGAVSPGQQIVMNALEFSAAMAGQAK